MELTKHHGLGNDFLVTFDDVEITAELARRLCDRRRGIGADGLMAVRPGSSMSHWTMDLRNSDGSLAAMSGNGIRCLAQAVMRRLRQPSAELTIDTGGGPRRVNVRQGDQAICEATVDMGPVVKGPVAITEPDMALLREVGATGRTATADIGNPHLIIEVDNPWTVDIAAAGPRFEAKFAGGINVEFVRATPSRVGELDVTVWERGAGVTAACGTGASVSAAVAHRWGLMPANVAVHMPGGLVSVALGETALLSGPAEFVCRVVIDHV